MSLMKNNYSTAEVASASRVSKRTLLRWLYDGKVPEPGKHRMGGIEVRIWSERDLQRVKDFREEHYRKRS